MRSTISAFPLLTLLACASGCGHKSDHGAPAGGCVADADCTGLGSGGPIGGSTPDATSDVAADVGLDGDAELRVTVSGDVRLLTAFPTAPSSGIVDTDTNLVVRGNQGATFRDVSVSGGTFTLDSIDSAPFTWISLLQHATPTTTQLRTIVGFERDPIPAGGTYALTIPVYSPELPQAWATNLGIGGDGGTSAGKATVVVQVVDAAGAPRKGATALAHASGQGPFYDDGSDGLVRPIATTSGTNAKGTIVFLSVDLSGTFAFPVTFGAVTKTVQPFIGADAVTYVRLVFP